LNYREIKPILEHPAKKFRINMVSAITNTGKSMFALYDESINIDRFIDFMQKVIDSNDKKVYLIVDNLRVHHAKQVSAWIEEHNKQIAIFYLPPYSPEFNPDEYPDFLIWTHTFSYKSHQIAFVEYYQTLNT